MVGRSIFSKAKKSRLPVSVSAEEKVILFPTPQSYFWKYIGCRISAQLISDIRFRTKVKIISPVELASKMPKNCGYFKFRTIRSCAKLGTSEIFGHEYKEPFNKYVMVEGEGGVY